MKKDQLNFIHFHAHDLSEAFQFYKLALHEIIQNAFGWDDDFQINRFRTQYELEWFNWIEIESKRIGYICYFQKESEIHVSLLIIFNEFQSKGHGKIVMDQIEQLARQQNKKVTLSSFKANEGAIRFYKSMGYMVTNTDEHFLDLSKS